MIKVKIFLKDLSSKAKFMNSRIHSLSGLAVVGAVKSVYQTHESLEYKSFINLNKNSNNSS